MIPLRESPVYRLLRAVLYSNYGRSENYRSERNDLTIKYTLSEKHDLSSFHIFTVEQKAIRLFLVASPCKEKNLMVSGLNPGNAREKKNQVSLRSFLGLCSFCSSTFRGCIFDSTFRV